MAYPEFPAKVKRELAIMASRYVSLIRARRYPEAKDTVELLFAKMLGWQDKYGVRLHKGYPLHNIGYTLYLQKNYEEALEYFLLAYIEDLLSVDAEDEADSTPAGQTLITGYKFNPAVIKSLKQIVAGFKGKNIIPSRPEVVLQKLKELLEKSKTGQRDIKARTYAIRKEQQLRPFTAFQSPWEKRVFVGGSIGLEFIIKSIAKIITNLGYDPIVCSEFDEPENIGIHDKCLILLHCCKYAVFDIAEQAGQLIEVERACDYNVNALLIWPKNKEEAITQMLKSQVALKKYRHAAYVVMDDVEPILKDFLTVTPQ